MAHWQYHCLLKSISWVLPQMVPWTESEHGCKYEAILMANVNCVMPTFQMKQPQLSHWKSTQSIPVWAVVTVRVSHQQPAMGFNECGAQRNLLKLWFPLQKTALICIVLPMIGFSSWHWQALALDALSTNTPRAQPQPGICMPLVSSGTGDFWNMQSDESIHLETMAIAQSMMLAESHVPTLCKYTMFAKVYGQSIPMRIDTSS